MAQDNPVAHDTPDRPEEGAPPGTPVPGPGHDVTDRPGTDHSGTGDVGTAPAARSGLVLGVLVLAAVVMLLNETLLAVALPYIMRDYGITAATAQWLSTGYMLTMAIVIPTTGYLLNRFTTRRMLAAALGAFCAGTLVAALAPAFPVLLLARVVQATGNAMMLPLLMTVALIIIPPERRGFVMGIIGVAISVAPAIGPTLSGFILEHATWHWLFWFMLPIGLLTLGAGMVYLRNVGETRRTHLDVPSVILSVFAFGGLVYAIGAMSQVLAGQTYVPLIALGVGAVGLVLFVRRQIRLLRDDRALLDLRPLRVRTFTLSLAVIAIGLGALIGTVTVLPLHLQNGVGLSALDTGLIVLPGAVLQGIISPFIGRIYDSMGPRPLIIPGAALMAVALWVFSALGAGFPIWLLIVMHCTLCTGLALVMTPLMTLALSALPPRLYAHGSAILNTLEQLAAALGVAILVGAMSVGLSSAAAGGAGPADAQFAGTRLAFTVGGVIMLVAVALTFLIRTPSSGRTGSE